MRSVRARTAAGATLVVALALVAAGGAVLLVLRGQLTDDARLRAEAAAREVAAQVPGADAARQGSLDGLDGDDPVQIVDARHRVLGASDPLRGHRPIAGFHLPDAPGDDDSGDTGDDSGDSDDPGDSDDAGDAGHAGGQPGGQPGGSGGDLADDGEDRSVALPVDDDGEVAHDRDDRKGEQDFQLVAVQSRTRDGVPVTVYAGSSLKDRQQAVASVARSMLTGLPALLAVVAAVTWLVTRRALRPVEGIRGEMAAIMDSTDLSRRVPEPRSHDEVARLARTTNATLAALEASVERQRQLVADASHELRSPIASLRTQLEVGAAHPELLDLPGAVQDTVRLQDLAADLLLLARLDAGERPGGTRVALDALVREELAQRPEDPHPVRTVELAAGEVAGSRAQLARVLGNLLDNAQRHARRRVTVAVRASGDELVLEVADDGPGVPAAERERIFERFVRLDDARSRDDGGAGLGLAIVRDVAHRHGGTASVTEGSRFAVRLPRAHP